MGKAERKLLIELLIARASQDEEEWADLLEDQGDARPLLEEFADIYLTLLREVMATHEVWGPEIPKGRGFGERLSSYVEYLEQHPGRVLNWLERELRLSDWLGA